MTALAQPQRPRSQRAEEAILEAAREILSLDGVKGLTVEGVAARSGVAKTTIYRRWRSKDDLALAVLVDLVEQFDAVPDMGDARSELTAAVAGAVRMLGDTPMGAVMRGLVSDIAADAALREAFQGRVVALRQGQIRSIVERGIARGELASDADAELIHELIFGPIYYRLLVSGRPLKRKYAERVVDAVLPAFTVTSAKKKRKKAGAGR